MLSYFWYFSIIFFTHLASGQPCAHQPSVQPSFRLVFIGAPGSGKTTISAHLNNTLGFSTISSGHIFRQEARKDTEIGRLINMAISSGKLAPCEVVVTFVLQHLATAGPRWILDGFPRTLCEAQRLNEIVGGLDVVIHLDVPFSVLSDRIAHRWVHIPSGRTYNTKTSPPRIPGRDDVTGELLERRTDDEPETVKIRYEIYKKQTAPILEFYRNLGIVKSFVWNNTDLPPKVQAYLEELMKRKKVPRFKTLFDGRWRNCSTTVHVICESVLHFTDYR